VSRPAEGGFAFRKAAAGPWGGAFPSEPSRGGYEGPGPRPRGRRKRVVPSGATSSTDSERRRGGRAGPCGSSNRRRPHALGLIPRVPELRFSMAHELRTVRRKVEKRRAGPPRAEGIAPFLRDGDFLEARHARPTHRAPGGCHPGPRWVTLPSSTANINYHERVPTAPSAPFCALLPRPSLEGRRPYVPHQAGSSARRSEEETMALGGPAESLLSRAGPFTPTSGSSYYEELFRWDGRATLPRSGIHGPFPRPRSSHIEKVSKPQQPRRGGRLRAAGRGRARLDSPGWPAPKCSPTAVPAAIIGHRQGGNDRGDWLLGHGRTAPPPPGG